MKRRDFIKSSLIASPAIFFIDSMLGKMSPNFAQQTTSSVLENFKNPPTESHLFVRWWWNGNRLDKKEILRELDVMKAAGIGGVEINPIAFPGDTNPVGFESLTIFEDDWLEMVEVALKGAKERGIVCDMIVGSGWPFGGEFLKKEEQSQMVTIETIDLKGPQKAVFTIDELLAKVDPQLHSKNKKVYKDIEMLRLAPKQSNRFNAGFEYIDEVVGNTVTIDVPEGDFVLYYVVKLTGFMAVINGAPGAAGPVLNHYNKEATEAYLNRVSSKLTAKIGDLGQYLRAMFCDSMELEGANWNDDFLAAFEKRNGYKLGPYLPFVLKKVGHMGNPLEEDYGTQFSPEVVDLLKRIELDYYETRIQLFKERFIHPFNEWCHKNNVQSRMQAYGRGMHPIEASMEVDIPEGETWMFKEIGRTYPNTGLNGRAPRMCNKAVASGAVLSDKKIVSCEEITNTAMAFMASLENIKVAGDQSNLSGVTHSILHGFNYSPLEAKFPGWIRYGAYFNERNTWWPYFKKWADYKARLSYILQQSTPNAAIAVLQPNIDLWLKKGPQRDPFPQTWYPEYIHNLWEVIHQNGNSCDLVSDRIIKESSFENGQMTFNKRSYHTLILPEVETIDLKTAQAITAFAESGGKVVFIGTTPFKSPSSKNIQAADIEVKNQIDKMLHTKGLHCFKYPAPEKSESLIEWFAKLQSSLIIKPQIQFDKPHPYLNQINLTLEGKPLYFISNASLSEAIEVEATFPISPNLNAFVLDPESGEKRSYPKSDLPNKLHLKLPKATSLLLYFDEDEATELYPILPSVENGLDISNDWKAEFKHMNGESFSLEMDQLFDLINDDKTKNFAGKISYSKNIEVRSTDEIFYIDLGDVQGISELWINGKYIGCKWYGAHFYALSNQLNKGHNQIRIEVTTIIGNYMKSLKDNKVAQNWTRHQEYFPMGLIGPIKLI